MIKIKDDRQGSLPSQLRDLINALLLKVKIEGEVSQQIEKHSGSTSSYKTMTEQRLEHPCSIGDIY
jgi:hypothetical protein